MRISLIVLICGFVLALSSCRTQKAVVNYIEDLTDTTTKKSYYITEPVIQKNDLLSIQVTSSSLDPNIDELYNLQVNRSGGGGGAAQGGQMQGYLVDQKGYVELPRIGLIQAAGLTKDSLASVIKTKLKDQLTDPTVIIRFLNFRIIVIGEVQSPGVKTINVENLTLLEALALAGDITEYGNKKEVKILRENNGQRQLGIIDVSNSKMFESQYYQLKQNDVIMVVQTKYKMTVAEQARVAQQIGFGLSIVAAIGIIINLFR